MNEMRKLGREEEYMIDQIVGMRKNRLEEEKSIV
jgi:hypothetical protein